MRHAIVGSLTALLAGAGLALAQQPDEVLPRPRGADTISAVPADQAGTAPVVVTDLGGDPGTAYGPPPIVAPVCGTQGPPYRLWIEGDYHLWWVKENHFPPLLVSIPAVGAATGTTVLAGGDSLDRLLRNGGCLTLGAWFTEYQGFGLEGSFFVMESAGKSFTAGSGAAGSAILARPFFDVLAGQPGFAPITVPGLVSGSAGGTSSGIQSDAGRFAGVGFDFIGNLTCGPSARLDLLVGYRYLTLDDRFAMTTDSATTTAGVLLANGQLVNSVADAIHTTSRFNGGEIGLRGEWFYERWLVRATAKVAFGATDEGADLAGVTTSVSATGATVAAGGFLARPSNSGSFSTEQFAIVPEAGLTLGYQVFDWMRLTAGYSFLYWSRVARPGEQVNVSVNRLEVPSLAAPTGFMVTPPAALIRSTDFWAHGINAGLELRY